MKKTLLSLIALLITAIAFAERIEIDGIYYNLNNENKTAEVTHDGDAWDYNGVGYTQTEITIPSSITYNSETYSVTSIGEYAFSECSSLTSITIPNSVTYIGGYAFTSSSLTSITIPNSVTYIGGYAFEETPWLSNQPDGCVYINNCLYQYKGSMPQNTHIDIKEGTTQICAEAFEYCRSLTSISIPNSVTSIGYRAFYYCSSLTSITIPNGINSIGHHAFYNCLSLISITIPNSVTYIGEKAFHGTRWLDNQPDGCIYIGSCLYEYEGVIPEGNIDVKEGTTQICAGAFEYCLSLTSITIPNSVTSIDNNAFSFCQSLTSITIPNSVTYIGSGAFTYCSALTSITIPNSVTSIGDVAFAYCSALTSITIPNSVTSVGVGVFLNCTSLKTANLSDKITELPGYYYDSESTYGLFSGCTSLTSVAIPNGVTLIGACTFYNCTSLTSIAIPEGVEEIGEAAFYGCNYLESITLPASLKSIGNNGFALCNQVKRMEVRATTPPTIEATTFEKVSRDIEFIIPEEARNAYAEHEYWKEFIQEIPNNIENNFEKISIFTTDGTIHIEGVESDYQIHTATGQLIYTGNTSTLSLPRGIYLVTIEGKTQKITL